VLSLPLLAGTLPYDAALQIPKEVWKSLPQLAQEMARAAGDIRAQFTPVAALADLDGCLDVSMAATNGVKVLRETAGTIDVGCVNLPFLTGLGEAPKEGEHQKMPLLFAVLCLQPTFVFWSFSRRVQKGGVCTAPASQSTCAASFQICVDSEVERPGPCSGSRCPALWPQWGRENCCRAARVPGLPGSAAAGGVYTRTHPSGLEQQR
jgi:hypothetical protein